MKKKNVMIITAAVLVCAITITGIARAVRGGGSAVDVTQVSYLNSGWWDEGTSTSGYVTANASQDVYLESDSVVEKVYVKKGDKVKIGDTLLEYDKTLLQLNLEEEQINKQIQELELQGAKNDLEKLKRTHQCQTVKAAHPVPLFWMSRMTVQMIWMTVEQMDMRKPGQRL